jgi:hypothetical protein
MEIAERIAQYLRVFQKLPAIYVIQHYGDYSFIDVLSMLSKTKWYKYGEPIGHVSLALMYEGGEISEDAKVRLIEVAVRHLKSRRTATILNHIEVQHIYEAKPIGPVVEIHKTENGITDVTQLEQFVKMRLQAVGKEEA